MNSLQMALVEAGLAERPKKAKKGRKFQCRKCGSPMTHRADENVMYCTSCNDSWFIFTNERTGNRKRSGKKK